MSELADDCLACHAINDERVSRPIGEACIECHEEGYDEYFIEWRNDAKDVFAELPPRLRDRIRTPAGLDVVRLRTMQNWMTQLQADGSNSVHNRELFEDVIERIDEYLATEASDE